MASNINPSLTPVNSLDNFRFWCQKVLPLVYDDSLSYYEVLGKMVVQLNDVIDNVNADTENVLTLKDAFLELQTYVNNFFDDIDQLASYAERAEAAQTAANTSAVNAATSASNASQSSLAAMDARDTAVAARQAAQTSANTASTAATNANTKANEAAQSAITAQTAQASASQSATLAATDRSAAQTAASTATTKANEANTSATNAETSAKNAAQSEANAGELVNNIQENLDNIQQNTQDINDLKESINNGFRSIFPTMLLPATAMCKGVAFGVSFVDGHAIGTVRSDKNVVITGNENLLPNTGTTSTMPEGYFSIYLPVGLYTMHIECGYAEYTNNAAVAQLFYAEKTERTPRNVPFSKNGLMKPNEKLTANVNITLAGWYMLRLYFPNSTPLNIKYWLTNSETSTTAMLLENIGG